NRNCETNALIAATVGGNRSVDTDHLTVKVDKRSARVAWVDRGIGLQKFGALDRTELPLFAADNAGANGLVEFERSADCDDPIADGKLVTIAKVCGREGFLTFDAK